MGTGVRLLSHGTSVRLPAHGLVSGCRRGVARGLRKQLTTDIGARTWTRSGSMAPGSSLRTFTGTAGAIFMNGSAEQSCRIILAISLGSRRQIAQCLALA